MIFHIVRYAHKASVPAAERAETIHQLMRLASLESVESVVVGHDLGESPEGFHTVVFVTFLDAGAFERYQTDRVHAEVIQYVVPKWAEVMTVDFTDDPDPKVQERIKAAVEIGAAQAPSH